MVRFPFDEMMQTLSDMLGDEVPAVTKVARIENKNPFLVLVGTLLSLRTKDETTEKAMERLTRKIRSPRELVDMPEAELEKLIYPVGFYRNKSKVLRQVADRIIEEYGGRVPDSIEELLKIKGIGRKTANLVVIEAYDKPGICVDTHVHRISNRIGIVWTKNPHKTEAALRAVLPARYWTIYNTLLVTFGKNICTPLSPWCSRCGIEHFCIRRGVARHR
jgi:endonuclease-3